MVRSATQRLKVNPPLGMMPALQYLLPEQLKVDPAYQRTLDTGPSQALIRRIAVHWNWDLCQPLVVAMREGGELFVIDGQHRLEAARLRGDILQLPAVVVRYGSAADEAASFVHLNQQRRPLSKLDVFKAAVASEDPEAVAISEAVAAAGLKVAPHSNHTTWKQGMISNIGGIEAAWRSRGGQRATKLALVVLARAFEGQVLQYAGTLFPGIVAVCAAEPAMDRVARDLLVNMLSLREQRDWAAEIVRLSPDVKGGRRKAAGLVLLRAWQAAKGRPMQRLAPILAKAPEPVLPGGAVWCGQCEQRVQPSQAMACASPFCKARPSSGAARVAA